MLSTELNFLILIFFIITTSIVINVNTSLHLVLTAEFLWVTLYSITLILGLVYNNINFTSLTFFFLILSAVEFSIGLVLIFLQFIFNRSLNLNTLPHSSVKFVNRFFTKLNLNRSQI